MPIQFSDMQDFFRNSFLSGFPPFYTTTIIQLSRCPYLQLITRSIILLFLHFVENSQNWQKLPMMIEFARATEWILYLTLHIQSRYKIKNLAKILAPEYIFLKILVFFDQNKGEIYERLLLFLKKNGKESPGDHIWSWVFFSGPFLTWITNSLVKWNKIEGNMLMFP